MKVLGVIQARLSSRRLPGKVLRPLYGKPSLAWLVEAANRAGTLAGVLIATSEDPSDDPTAQFARSIGVSCFRGSLDNVAQRLLAAGQSLEADAIVRLNGDSPLMDPRLIDHAVRLFSADRVDLVTNVHPRSFPKGQSVEVISLQTLERCEKRMSAAEREHVTPYFYANASTLSILSFQADQPRPEVQLSIDEQRDFDRCEAIMGMLAAPPWQAGWQACVAAYDAIEAPLAAGRAT